MSVSFTFKDKYNINDLLDIMSILRAPGGCPWDAEQTHESIRSNFIEEVYEAVDAIDKQDVSLLKEELGDVLMQVVFHAEIEREGGGFDFDDVADTVCKKLIERHPHVFGSVSVDGTEDVLRNWDAIKKKSKGQNATQSLVDVPRTLPALMRSSKVQHRASRVGFDWDDYHGAVDKLDEEVAELKQAIELGNAHDIEDELGDVLFSAVNAARLLGIDPENALTKACNKFINRFSIVEKLAHEKGMKLDEQPLSVLDELWDEAKLIILEP
ncbi:MAG: nucleoside triphosphate pyrophosphohydrolase [Clostridia bacterium]|nr:nucleoside triphosphate pyrophosphohydrolase [Clostridia bacterium]